MPNIEFNNKPYPLNDNETVLEGLLRHGVDIPHGCRAGACQSCLMKVEHGDTPIAAQIGLKQSQKQLGYFLACLCKPNNDLTLCRPAELQQQTTAKILSKNRLSHSVLQLKLEPKLAYRAGQYINIWHGSNTVRSYSIASVYNLDNFIELHIKLIEGGKFSQFADKSLKPGDELTLQGPLGECIYSATSKQQSLLLVGIGTGLAPLIGIVRDALNQHHSGTIHLILGARSANDFYLTHELALLDKAHQNLNINWIAQAAEGKAHVKEGDLYEWVKQAHPSTKNFSIYLCGAPSFVQKMKKQCFLAGANMADIHSDAFLPCS